MEMRSKKCRNYLQPDSSGTELTTYLRKYDDPLTQNLQRKVLLNVVKLDAKKDIIWSSQKACQEVVNLQEILRDQPVIEDLKRV